MTYDRRARVPDGVCAVLRNPAAGRGRRGDAVAAALRELESSGHEVRVLDATSAAEAQSVCYTAVSTGLAALVAVGGDGTIHLAVQAVAGTDVPLGIVPAGTGNDFATAVDVPSDPVAAAKAIADALKHGRSRPVDLGRITGPDGYARWFAAVLGAGFDAIVNERANAMRWPKGRRRYDIAIFSELLRLRPRRYTLTLDDRVIERDAVLVAVGNTASYGGGMRMCPAADPSDGLLDVVVAGPISRTTLLRLQPRVYNGTHVQHPALTSLRARTVTIEADGITAYADGERLCSLPVTITAQPAALTLLT